MSKFTDAYIRSLKPKDYAYDIREGQGFGVRVTPTGTRSFFYLYRYHGQRRRLALGTYPEVTLAKARRKFDAARGAFRDGNDPAGDKQQAKHADRATVLEARKNPTVATLVAEYIERHAKPNKKSWREDERILNRELVPMFGMRKAADVTRRDVVILLDGITDRGAVVMANRTLAAVRKCFRFGVQRGLLDISPVQDVPRPGGPEKPRERTLTESEITTLFEAELAKVSPYVLAALRLILVTAQRPGEVRSMRRDDLDFESRNPTWTIPETKNNRAHTIPLTAMALAILNEVQQLELSDVYVFRSPRGDADKPIGNDALPHATRNAGWAWRPHDLRRTAATQMGMLGVTRFVQDRVLNHVDATIGAVYDRQDYLPEMRVALEKWERELRRILGEPDDASVVPIRRA